MFANNYTATFIVNQDDITELPRPYGGILEIRNEVEFTFAAFDIDFYYFTKDKLIALTDAMKHGSVHDEIHDEGGNGFGRVKVFGPNVTFTVGHFGYAASFTLQINDSLIAAFEHMCVY